MRRIAYLRWLAPVLAAFLAAGCGVLTSAKLKPHAKTLTHGRLVYLADRACAADLSYDRTLKRAATPGAFVKTYGHAIKSGEHFIFVLRGLTPPPSDAKAYRRFLAAENGADLIANHFLEQYGDMTRRTFEHDVHRFRILGRRIKARAKKLGLDVCAKD